MPDKPSYSISPLGAAVVEAMPDNKAVAKIKRNFKHSGSCPTSAIFPSDTEVREFYQAHHDTNEESRLVEVR